MTTFVSLDGVMQAPGGPNEDTSNGFSHGGWCVPYVAENERFGQLMDEWFDRAGGFVLGRKTYEIFAAHWPHVGNEEPVAAKLNSLPKYVASKTLDEVSWNNSTLLTGDVAEAVANLKQEDGGELQVHGSGDLAQTLMRQNLIDVVRLWISPVVLGSGARLFRSDWSAAFQLTEAETTDNGLVMQTYTPAGEVTHGSFELEADE